MIREHIIILGLLGYILYDAKNSVPRPQYEAVVEELDLMREEYEKELRRVQYLAAMIDKNGVPITEFDIIALTDPISPNLNGA